MLDSWLYEIVEKDIGFLNGDFVGTAGATESDF